MNAKNIEDIYPLSPMQQGILFHSIYSAESGLYILQESYELHGNLDVAAFEQAWQQVITRHSILRTAFVWENVEQPIQIVGKQVKLPLQKYDWRGLSLTEQQNKLQTFSQAEKQRIFKLAQAPLMHLSLIRLSENVYQFIWSYHHLILDGWSLSLLLKEVLIFYKAFHIGQNIHLERSRSYRDYIAWLQQQDRSQAQKFWQQYLHNFTTPTLLSVDQRSNSLVTPTQNYAQQNIQLSTATKITLQSLVRQHQLTLITLLHGVWALLSHRYSGEKDLVFGSTSSGRPLGLIGAESMIGVFINTLPIRVQVNPEDFLIPWLQQLQNQQIELLQYDYSPLVEIQGWSEVPKGLPLFESILISQDYQVDSSSPADNSDLQILNVSSNDDETNYPLSVSVGTRSKLQISISYDCQRFDNPTITRMLEHLQTLLVEISNNPNQKLKDLQILTPVEEHQLLVEWNDTKAEYPIDKCIHELFEATVERTPDAVAVVFEDQQLTYRELNVKANQLAHYLRSLGVKTEEIVGICVERSLEMAIAILGVLKAGGAYVPLDPAYPPQRLAYMFSDASVSVMVTQNNLLTKLSEYQEKLICLDTDWEKISGESQENPVIGVQANNLAYVIYTSGSTGKPKGVMIEHQSLVNLAAATTVKYKMGAGDRILQFASISFDVAAEEIYSCFICGGTLVLRTDEILASVSMFMENCRNRQITVLDLPTAYWHLIVSELANGNLTLPESLRLVIIGGESALPEKVAIWQKQVGNYPQLINAYGPTEATVNATCCNLSTTEVNGQEVPIGYPISNVQVYLLDQYLQLVPVGVPGEIYIGGAGLARGYLNSPELTEQKFIANPLKTGTKLYQTGDLGRYRPDGTLEFIGRIDEQVKVRGFRIELGEIESILVQHPTVCSSVVVLREDEPGSKRLVAYIVAQPEQLLIIDQLRRFLENKLPNYMVPSAFVVLEALPLTPNGKVDRQGLPAPDTRPELEAAFIAPQTTVEKQLAQIWAQVLGLEKVGVNDNFFALGGDSIISLQIVSKANQAGLHLTPKQIFKYQTIAQLATVVGISNEITTEQGLVTGSIPLTPIQHWFFAQNLPDVHHWNQSLLLEVRQPLDLGLLKEVVRLLLGHHDALRLHFTQDEKGWKAVISPPSEEIPLTRFDFSHLSSPEQETAIAAAADQIQASLNLSAGPLVKIAYFNLGAERSSRLLWVIHHLAVDGVSWRVLVEDFQTAYQQLSQSQTIHLPVKTTSFKHWSEKLQEYAHTPALHSEIDYWQKAVKSVTPLPIDYPGGENTNATARTISVSLGRQETQALLQDVPVAYRTQINDVLLAALVQTFAQWTGQPSLLIDLEGHGREEVSEDIDLSRTVGWFTSIFPVLLDLEKASNPGELLLTVKEQLRNIPQRGFGYGVLRYLSDRQEITAVQPEVVFNYLGQLDQVLPESSLFQLTQEYGGIEQSLQSRRTHLLELNGSISQGRLQMNWTYSENLHRHSTIEKLAQGFLAALRDIIAHSQSSDAGGFTPSDFAEFQQSQWNQSDLDAIAAVIRGM
jgi:amino acid adenylation domain-containing protein/non-ribosomal peptide synthase protein (TIGR01720 family)